MTLMSLTTTLLVFIFLYSEVLNMASMSVFNIRSLNVNGARDHEKRAVLFEFIRLKKANLFFIQDTHSDDNHQTAWNKV